MKIIYTSGSLEHVTHLLRKQNKEVNKMSYPFKEMKCKQCGEPPQTTLTHDGLCVGCIAYMFEDCV